MESRVYWFNYIYTIVLLNFVGRLDFDFDFYWQVFTSRYKVSIV